MNTPGNLIVGVALFSKPGAGWIVLVALAGAAIPALSVIGVIAWARYVGGHEPS